jgi:protocatechuate 3,4-dioxygenase beta subunit
MFAAVALMVTALAGVAAGRQQTRSSAGSGTISGRAEIVEPNLRAPLRRATVTLRSESGDLTRTTATDADGLYRFAGLPAAKYRVSVEKAGFLATPGIDSGNPFPESSLANGAQLVVNFIAERAVALEGRVIEDTGRPIADLTVTADRVADASGRPVISSSSFSAKTDDLGRFRVHTLPAGGYRVSATPPSPASGARLYYPGTEKIQDAPTLVTAAGQTMDNLTFVVATGSLPAMAAEAMATQELDALNAPTRGGNWAQITGRVTRSDAGQPIPNAAVKLSTGAGALLRTAWTDGAGEYSFGRVMAGAYQVSVSADGYAKTPGGGGRITVGDGERLKKDLVLIPLSAVEGRVLDEFGDPAPGVFLHVAPRAAVAEPGMPPPPRIVIAPTDDRGWFRVSGLVAGEYYLMALPEPFARSGPAAFPITSLPLQLGAGIDAHGVNLMLPPATTAVISGIVTDATGRRVPKALVTLSPVLDGPLKGIFRAPVTADANGNFFYPSVPAGTYLVAAMAPGALQIGSLTITTPTEPFVIAVKPLPTASGRVTFDGGAPPVLRQSLQDAYGYVDLRPVAPPPEGLFGAAGLVQPDWSFKISGIRNAGVIRAGERAADLGWTLLRVLLQGRDITDVPYDFQSGDVDGIEVILTKRVGGITGTVADRGINPIAVVVFGADGDSWPYLLRTLRTVQPSLAGAFTVRGLLPGHYFVAAVSTGTPRSEEALRALRPVATPVVVSEGVDASIRLAIVR